MENKWAIGGVFGLAAAGLVGLAIWLGGGQAPEQDEVKPAGQDAVVSTTVSTSAGSVPSTTTTSVTPVAAAPSVAGQAPAKPPVKQAPAAVATEPTATQEPPPPPTTTAAGPGAPPVGSQAPDPKPGGCPVGVVC